MRIPLSWLKDFAPLDPDPGDLARVLDDLGLVVEGIERVGEGLDQIVVSRVVSVDSIKGADRIRLVTVDAGSDPVKVVCGAWNFEVGDLVPLAPVGSTLPGGMTIERREMRGVTSEGMLCSGRELGLSADGAGLLVLGAASGEAMAPGTPLVEALAIESDVVYDLAIEANRPDAMSVVGVARDVAAKLGLPFALPEDGLSESDEPAVELATIAVAAPELCPRFTGRVIRGVTVGESPPWMTRRLVLAGMRPINSVVDASNYVMLELGQPNHAYDLDRLNGGGLLVRAAEADEVVLTLDGEERRLGGELPGGGRAEDCLICDATGQPVGIAGIMGGASTEISDRTQSVLLETAYFAPMAIARTAKRLGLRTEASARFERGTDPEGIDMAAARTCKLITDSGGETASGLIDVSRGVPTRPRLVVRTERVNEVLGTSLEDADVSGYLGPIGFEVMPVATGRHEVRVPSFRPDVTREIDVIEEIARHHGYSSIERTVPAIRQVGRLSPVQRGRRQVRQVLIGTGASEAWTPTFLDPDAERRAGLQDGAVEVANPLVREESVLRRRLLPGLLDAVSFNAARRQHAIHLFEIGHVFGPPAPDDQLPDERENLAVVMARPGDSAASAVSCWRSLAGALRLADPLMESATVPGLHPTRSARLSCGGTELGALGEIDPEVMRAWELDDSIGRAGYLEVDLGLLLSAPRLAPEARPVSRYPSSDIDLAFEVDEMVPAAAVGETLAACGGELLESVTLFDVYRGPAVGSGARSLAFRLRWRAFDRTLTDEEVAAARTSCIEAVATAHGGRLRG